MVQSLQTGAPVGRVGAGAAQVQLIERASALIAELGVQLDRHLDGEARPSERMRMLREATNRITRAANDAIAAYRTGVRVLTLEVERNGPNVESAIATLARLREARRTLLQALEAADRRYPWTEKPSAPTGREKE
jgi:hypothetical protein